MRTRQRWPTSVFAMPDSKKRMPFTALSHRLDSEVVLSDWHLWLIYWGSVSFLRLSRLSDQNTLCWYSGCIAWRTLRNMSIWTSRQEKGLWPFYTSVMDMRWNINSRPRTAWDIYTNHVETFSLLFHAHQVHSFVPCILYSQWQVISLTYHIPPFLEHPNSKWLLSRLDLHVVFSVFLIYAMLFLHQYSCPQEHGKFKMSNFT